MAAERPVPARPHRVRLPVSAGFLPALPDGRRREQHQIPVGATATFNSARLAHLDLGAGGLRLRPEWQRHGGERQRRRRGLGLHQQRLRLPVRAPADDNQHDGHHPGRRLEADRPAGREVRAAARRLQRPGSRPLRLPLRLPAAGRPHAQPLRQLGLAEAVHPVHRQHGGPVELRLPGDDGPHDGQRGRRERPVHRWDLQVRQLDLQGHPFRPEADRPQRAGQSDALQLSGAVALLQRRPIQLFDD